PRSRPWRKGSTARRSAPATQAASTPAYGRGGADHLFHVVGVPAELREDEARRLFSLITRWKLNAASSAVSSLPLSNFTPRLIWKVRARPSLLICQDSARSPISLLASAGSGM